MVAAGSPSASISAGLHQFASRRVGRGQGGGGARATAGAGPETAIETRPGAGGGRASPPRVAVGGEERLLALLQGGVVGVVPPQGGAGELEADELGLRGVAVLLEPVRVDEAGLVVVWVLVTIGEQSRAVARRRG